MSGGSAAGRETMTDADLICLQAAQRLQRYHAEGRIVRGEWTGTDADGRETACLLAALSPEVAQAKAASACPAKLLPQWFAVMVPNIDDEPSEAAWPGLIDRFVALAARWHVLTAEDWARLDYACRAVAVREARRHVDGSSDTMALVDKVLVLLERAAAGEEVAARAARAAAADAADAAVTVVARARVRAEAWDRIADGVLSALESACDRAQGPSAPAGGRGVSDGLQ